MLVHAERGRIRTIKQTSKINTLRQTSKNIRIFECGCVDVRVRILSNVSMETLSTSKKPAQKDWHKAHIKAAVEIAGYTLRGLSRLHGLSTSYFREALHRPLPRAEKILAELIGVTPQKIWPSRYETDGTPKRGLYDKSHVNGRDYQVRMVRKGEPKRKGESTDVRRAA